MSQIPKFTSHSDYFAARAIEERRMAMAARDAHVRDIHLDMARRYEEAAQADDGATVQRSEEPRRVG